MNLRKEEDNMVSVELTLKATLTSQEAGEILNAVLVKEIDEMMKKAFGEEKKV